MLSRFHSLVLFITLAFCGSWLYHTNPRTKALYIDQVLQEFPKIFCEQPGETQCEALCEATLPITQLVVRGTLNLYTSQPKDFGLFTLYSTRFPWVDLHGVGIGGQILLWPPMKIPPNFCQEVNRDSSILGCIADMNR